MADTTAPSVPYQAIAAAFVTWMAANVAKGAADKAELETRQQFDDLALAHLKKKTKLVIDMGDKRTGDDQASKLSGHYILISRTELTTGDQVNVELVRK